jgi:hypothetical protein
MKSLVLLRIAGWHPHCWIQRVQKTEHPARLPHLSATGGIFCIITSLLIISPVSVHAGEPVVTVALEDQQTPVKSTMPAATNFLSVADSPLFELKSAPPAMLSLEKESEVAAETSTTAPLEKAVKADQREPLQLVHKNLSNSSRSNVALSVQAGYGRIWDDQSMLSKISGNHQETGCAYLGARISF